MDRKPHSPPPPPSALQPGAKFRGSVHLTGPARIDGSIDGELIASDCVWIGETASIRARVTAPEIIIDGQIDGSIHATDRIELRKTARVRAEVRAPILVLEEGAILEGRCSAGVDSSEKTPDRLAISDP